MDKQQVLDLVSRQLDAGIVSKEEILWLVGERMVPAARTPVGTSLAPQEVSGRNLTHTFYTIGTIIAIVGVGILVVQNWNDIGFAGRILVTLGLALVTYVAALTARRPEQSRLADVLFVISACLAPIGIFVLLDEGGVTFSSGAQALSGLILAVIFGTAYFTSRRNVTIMLTAIFASWAYYAGIVKVFDITPYDAADTFKWATMLLGIAYVLIGYGYRLQRDAVPNFFYGFGTLEILGAGISFGGTFDIFYIALIFAAFYGSVYLKSRMMLGLGAIFLIAHIIKLTSKYFVDSIGWPVALIAIGFVIIGIGYFTVYLNKKFVSVA